MEWEYLESLYKRNEIKDLNKDNSKQFIDEFKKITERYNLLSRNYRETLDRRKHVWLRNSHGIEQLLKFESIESSGDFVCIVSRSHSEGEIRFYLTYDYGPKFAFFNDKENKPFGVYISMLTGKVQNAPGVTGPTDRLEDVFAGFRPSEPLSKT